MENKLIDSPLFGIPNQQLKTRIKMRKSTKIDFNKLIESIAEDTG
jgi:hypothetical protein